MVQWDPAKAAANLKKHGVDFADAALVLEDPRALTIEDRHPQEERFVSIGTDDLGRILLVCWTLRDEDFRLISARKATRRQRQQYEEEK